MTTTHRSSSRLTRRQPGFTLIELMITVAVLAILATVGAPAMQNLIQQNRIAGAKQDFVAAINLARAEAIRRGDRVSVSTTNDNGFSGGYCVHTGNACTGDGILRQMDVHNRVSIDGGGVSAIRFDGRGRRVVPTSGTLTIQLAPVGCTPGRVAGARQVTVRPSGQLTTQEIACTGATSG